MKEPNPMLPAATMPSESLRTKEDTLHVLRGTLAAERTLPVNEQNGRSRVWDKSQASVMNSEASAGKLQFTLRALATNNIIESSGRSLQE